MSTLFIRRNSRKRPRVDIVPMIDVMFFLVVFFMIFSTFRFTYEGIHVDLPRAASAQEQVASEVVVTITKEGAYYFDDRLTTAEGLKDAVRRALAENREAVVIIRADREARWEWVVTAMDAMTEAGGSSVSFTVERPR